MKLNSLKILGLLTLLFCTWIITGCGGSGGGGTSTVSAGTGYVDGHVYVPYGSSTARVAAAVTGYKPYSGATVNINCDNTTLTGTTDAEGYFNISSVPAQVYCTVEVEVDGYITLKLSNVIVAANQSTSATNVIKMTPVTSGMIIATANIAGGTILIDGENTGIVVQSTLSCTVPNLSPGQHSIDISKSGFVTEGTQQVTITAGNTENVTFKLEPAGNSAPVANATVSASNSAGDKYTATYYTLTDNCNLTNASNTANIDKYTLDGSASNDPDGQSITYTWKQTSGPSATLSSTTVSKPTFVPTSGGTYVFSLTVNDGYVDSTPASVSVTIVQPSGKIVFSSCGYIYKMNADGSSLQIILSQDSHSGSPHWSGDGTKILFTTNPSNDGETYYLATMSSSGSNMNVTAIRGTADDWSPDGTRILYTSKNDGELYDYLASSGSGVRQLTSTQLPKGFAQYSPDGAYIAFTQDYGSGNYQLMVMNSDGTNITRLTNDTKAHYFVSWSTDSTHIYYTTADSLGENHVLYSINKDASESQAYSWPSGVSITSVKSPMISSDGKFMYYMDNQLLIHLVYLDGQSDLSFGLPAGNFDYTP